MPSSACKKKIVLVGQYRPMQLPIADGRPMLRGLGLFHGLFFFNDTATTEIYTLSLHDALPISLAKEMKRRDKLKDWRTDFVRFAIVDSKHTGVPFNLSRLADELVEMEFLQRQQPKSKAERLAFDRDKATRRKSI